mgnify:CR=1 FL=1
MKPALLKISGLKAHYGGIAALKGVDLEVRPGELVSVIGANGAGKSTLAKTLSGVLPAMTGDVRFAGERITSWPSARRVQLKN